MFVHILTILIELPLISNVNEWMTSTRHRPGANRFFFLPDYDPIRDEWTVLPRTIYLKFSIISVYQFIIKKVLKYVQRKRDYFSIHFAITLWANTNLLNIYYKYVFKEIKYLRIINEIIKLKYNNYK